MSPTWFCRRPPGGWTSHLLALCRLLPRPSVLPSILASVCPSLARCLPSLREPSLFWRWALGQGSTVLAPGSSPGRPVTDQCLCAVGGPVSAARTASLGRPHVTAQDRYVLMSQEPSRGPWLAPHKQNCDFMFKLLIGGPFVAKAERTLCPGVTFIGCVKLPGAVSETESAS